VLRSKFLSSEQVEAVVRDYRNAGLTPADVAMCAFAEKIILNAYKVTENDIAVLRDNGFSDEDILDIALAAGFRAMFSKVLDAVGAEPDVEYLNLEPRFAQALTVGRPLSKGGSL
jgi:alkylhydroperoxidase family enzyme